MNNAAKRQGAASGIHAKFTAPEFELVEESLYKAIRNWNLINLANGFSKGAYMQISQVELDRLKEASRLIANKLRDKIAHDGLQIDAVKFAHFQDHSSDKYYCVVSAHLPRNLSRDYCFYGRVGASPQEASYQFNSGKISEKLRKGYQMVQPVADYIRHLALGEDVLAEKLLEYVDKLLAAM